MGRAVAAAPALFLTLWNQTVPYGTMSVQRRPRIPDDLAAHIDRVRGHVPFETWVRFALGEYIETFCDAQQGRGRSMSYGGAVLTELACSDLFQLNLKEFDMAVAEARGYVVAELDRQAVEDEHDDPDVI